MTTIINAIKVNAKNFLIVTLLTALTATSSFGAVVSKATTGTDLNAGASWTGG